MAADQRKKPVTTVRRVVSHHDQGKHKKSNIGLFPERSNIVSLEWDDNNNSVVAKKEQIGLSQRHLISLGSSDFHCPNGLADVLTLPREVFELDIVREVLSYEVWQTLLSENERNYLMQFLPDGVDRYKVVQELLNEHSDFHFGNPFLKWSASLSSGNLHPDFIMNQEHCIRARKKKYYSDLLKYHNGMINSLLMWKERWSTSKNPEEEIMQKMWSRKQAANMSSDVKENALTKVQVQEDVGGTSESSSLAAEDNAGNSDNQNLVSPQRESKQRKVILEDGYNDLAAGLKMVERPTKGESLPKQNIQRCDGSKYMSYIKVSKKQHQLVKSSMKHNSNSIQYRSLNRVLGNLHNFHIQPFEVFEEEERKKLHAHWLHLAITDVPSAFANFRTLQLAKSRLSHEWKKEMEEKLVSLNEADQDDKKDLPSIISPVQAASNDAADAMEIEETKQPDCLLQEHTYDRAYDNKLTIPSGAVEKVKTENINEEMMGSGHDSQLLASVQNQQIQKITELGGDKLCSIEPDTGNYVIRERDNSQPNAPDYSGNLKKVGANLVDSSNIWPFVGMGNSYGPSTQLLSPGYSEEQQSGLISLEFDNNGQVAGNNMWHRQSHDGSFLNSFAIGGGQNEPHHHYFKSPDTLPYLQQEHKHAPFDFEQPRMHMPLIDLAREKNLNDVEVDINSSLTRDRVFSSEGLRCNIPMQQHLSADKIIQPDWAANAQSCFSFGDLVQNRVMAADQTLGGWSKLESSSQVPGAGSRSNIDESLYGVGLSRYNNNYYNNNNNTELPYVAPFDLARGPTQQLTEFGFGGDLPSGQESLSSSAPHPHSLVMNSNSLLVGVTEPIDIPLQRNSALQDSMIRPFLRPWNS